jgi:hypothetical protein
MSSPAIDFGKSFTFLFRDRDWLMKVLLGGVWVLGCAVLIGIPVLLGYSRRSFLKLVEDDAAPLPQWNFQEDVQAGLPVLGAALIYGGATIGVNLVLGFIPCLGWLIGMAVSLALSFVMPAVCVSVWVKGRFDAAFDFDWIMKFISSNPGNYVIAVVLSFIAALLSQLGYILFVIGVVFTSFWAIMVSVHLYAQVYRAWSGGAAAPVAPPQA